MTRQTRTHAILAVALGACGPLETIGATGAQIEPGFVSVAIVSDMPATKRHAIERGLDLWIEGGCAVVVSLVEDPDQADVTIEVAADRLGHLGWWQPYPGGSATIQIYRHTSGLAGVVAHELGHHLLWSGEHAPDNVSIMSEAAWWSAGDELPAVSAADAVLMAGAGIECVPGAGRE